MKFPKDPSFKLQDPYSAIEKISARLIVFPTPNDVYLSGSCFRLAKNLYVTAKHVITDYIDSFGVDSDRVAAFELWAVHVKDGPEYSVWAADRVWLCPLSDLAVIHTRPYNDVASKEREIACVGIELIPPAIGERVVGFGHHKHSGQVRLGEDGTRHIEVSAFGAASVGEVQEIHHEKRDSANLPFPCFRTNARFDGGMSGGPIFSDRGKVCGVVCSNLPPEGEEGEHVSYAAILWPLMGTFIDVDRLGNAVDHPYPLLELARYRVVHAEGWERVSIRGSIEGRDLQVQIEKY